MLVTKHLPILKTKRLKLRPMDINDSEQVVLWRNMEHVVSNSIVKNKIKLNEHINWFKESRKSRIDYIIEIISLNKMIGVLSFKILHVPSKLVFGEIGKYIGEKKELGKGYAIEGTRRWIEFGFEYCNFDQIFSITKKTNFINIHINKRLGLTIDHSYDEKDEYHKMYILKP